MDQTRIIFHIDMDSFYASIEIRENPDYKELPLVVGIGPNIRKFKGVVSTASYKAREYGIYSGMSLGQAVNKCRDLVIVPARISFYKQISNNIMKILKKYADKFEQISIDEAYIDVSNRIKDFNEAKNLANRIKSEIYINEKLTCSVGIAPNKTIAKIASGYNKPSGITIVYPSKIREFLDPLSVKKIPGVGIKIQKILEQHNIRTIKDLTKTKKFEMIKLLGKVGGKIYDIAIGAENTEVKPRNHRKSIGIIRSFENATNDLSIIHDKLKSLSQLLFENLIVKQLKFKTIGIILRFDDFLIITRSKTLKNYVNDYNSLFENAKTLLDNIFAKDKRKVKRIGIKVSNLKKIKKNKYDLTDFFN
ncbi:MAG: DNA polymerase IV [Candidatus Helarchaeota archaeon]